MNKKRLSLFVLILLVFLLTAAGCMGQSGDGSEKTPGSAAENTATIDQKITLYFSDDQAMYLKPETRTVTVEKARQEEQTRMAVIDELIKGPEDSNLYQTIPPETKLLGIQIKDKIAYVDFSEEIRTKHWGGSTGEIMTMGSIVNSLTELEGIEKVLVLIEGETQDTLVGHLDISEPSGRIESLLE
ncbi:MAG: GerMN domain-containing protein [Syntrophomonadaceae bacterium]|jgi:germination protein M|nr:GerMN domain-containing protein [Syntrophomonadaceae bacterium]